MRTQELLNILACPACHGALAFEENEGGGSGFSCEACGLLYPIEDEIPIMLVEKALSLEAWRGERRES